MREHPVNDSEEAARRLFAAAAEDVPPGIDLLRGVRARRRGRVVRIRSLVAVGAAAIVAAVVAITVSAVQAPSAFAQVMQAAARTAAQSYQVSSTSSLVKAPGLGSPQPTVTVTGEFDPSRDAGEWTTSRGVQIRNVGGYVYVTMTTAIRTTFARVSGVPIPAGKSWLRIPMPAQSGAGVTTAELALLGGIPVNGELVDPQSLLSLLESATAVRDVGPASGAGWTGSAYTFTVTTTLPGPVHVTVSTSGTVDVDQQGRVRQLAAVESIAGPEPIGGTERKVTLTFGDFGLPVSVSTPPASEIFAFPAR
jgi:hypothetical protein